jgi:hypothetical protein
MKDAFAMGVAKANALKEGDVFQGAYPEAEAAGYWCGTLEFSAFVIGYLSTLERRFPRGIITDTAGRLKNHSMAELTAPCAATQLPGTFRERIPMNKSIAAVPTEDVIGMDLIRRHRGLARSLAKGLNITPGAISQWKRVPAKHLPEVERISGIPRWILRPDICLPPYWAKLS